MKTISRIWLYGYVFVGAFVSPRCVMSQDATEVRSAIRPETEALVGERVVLIVDVLGKDSWARIPSLPQFDVDGAIVYVPPSQNTRLSETIAGDSYTGQRYEWWIYPHRAGPLSIPPIALSIEKKTYVPSESTVTDSVSSEPQSLQVVFPKDGSTTLTFNSLASSQSWSDLDREFRAGDGITRTIERKVNDAPSLLLPPLTFDAPDGASIISKQPSTENRLNRGELVGSRVDTVTYLFESAGTYEIPAVIIEWFDRSAGEHKRNVLDGITLEVASAGRPASQVVAATTLTDTNETIHRLAFLVLPVGFLAALLFYFRSRLSQFLLGLKERIQDSEPMRFRRFVREARSGSPACTLRELTRWSDGVQVGSRAPTISELFLRFGDERARRRLDALYGLVDRNALRVDFGELIESCRRIRRKVLRGRSRKLSARSVLPPLRSSALATGLEADSTVHDFRDVSRER